MHGKKFVPPTSKKLNKNEKYIKYGLQENRLYSPDEVLEIIEAEEIKNKENRLRAYIRNKAKSKNWGL